MFNKSINKCSYDKKKKEKESNVSCLFTFYEKLITGNSHLS